MIIAIEGITNDFFDAFLAYLVRSVVSRINTDIPLKSNMIMFYKKANLIAENRNIILTFLCIITNEPIEAYSLKVFRFNFQRQQEVSLV